MVRYVVPVTVIRTLLVEVDVPPMGDASISLATDQAKVVMAAAHPDARLHVGIPRKAPAPAPALEAPQLPTAPEGEEVAPLLPS